MLSILIGIVFLLTAATFLLGMVILFWPRALLALDTGRAQLQYGCSEVALLF